MARFLGVWTYDPASPQTLVNLVVTVPSGAGVPSLSPVQGAVRFTSEHYGTIVAHIADGCRWTLAVQGHPDLPAGHRHGDAVVLVGGV
jgi:hypothetical protein